MEEEAREILKAGVSAKSTPQINLADAIRRHLVPLGGVKLALRQREAVRRPPEIR